MLSRIGKKLRNLRRLFSPSESTARYLQMTRPAEKEYDEHTPAVVMIQIDGLGYEQMLHAIEKKRLPFLQRLIQRDNFVLRQFYSGLPSTTPAVQAELFYGVKSAVPAFQYYDRRSGREIAMYEAEAVDELARRMEREHLGLLKGGSSYSNIYGGGADEAHFCIQSMTLESIFHDVELRKIGWFIIINLGKILRIIGLFFLETALAAYDFIKGLIRRKSPLKEFKFIFSRIGTSIVLRELVRLHVKIDIARGLPIIHANFVGYDEHAHRRNPNSAFALWTLKGIDAAIKDLVQRAVRSEKRDYHIFIYSDHGQEASVPFVEVTGVTLRQAVKKVFAEGPLRNFPFAEPETIIPHFKLHQRNTALFWRTKDKKEQYQEDEQETNQKIHITAMGPLGHIYLPVSLEDDGKEKYAQRLVQDAQIPLIFYRLNDAIICVNATGGAELDAKAEEVFGSSHPFLEQLTGDMERICRHPDAGEFVVSGWRPDQPPLTFVVENGAHGGPGSRETRGFVILPDTASGADQSFLRPVELRTQVEEILNTVEHRRETAASRAAGTRKKIKVMSYNIHSCIGIDGKLFPGRIARVVRRQQPDIIALQEVDRNMARTGYEDQADVLGRMLGMYHCYFPVVNGQGGEYGLAVLSRYPVKKAEYFYLPQRQQSFSTEKRGVMCVAIDSPAGPVHIFNTHLSLYRRERIAQMGYIVDNLLPEYLQASESVIFCGDFNAGVHSPSTRLLAGQLDDCQNIYPDFQPEGTFFSSYPFLRLDHIFHSRQLTPESLAVVDDWECRLASDHLPILTVLRDERICQG